ncbi:MAG: DUF3267 domain-containing protein [Intestinibacter sp.]|uniref:DUF3267 domain-containing protein n=1 Tax=Intestinibacter sp. TaxID=1965304 RepID=UPI002A83CADF|nr:DUF3267 domain-containing protein [Intestinibacter sp.]MDY4575932.1 DUF3267 domain-containing protein [Intestinibacter sp.]
MKVQNNQFLEDNSKLVLKFDYTNCFDLIHEWLDIPSIISKIYKKFFHIMFIIFIISIFFRPSIELVILNLGFAVLFFLVFIGVHQFLHLIAAYIIGCRSVKLIIPKANIFCYCDRMIFTSSEYIFVSIFPFVITTISSLLLAINFPEYIGAAAIFNILNVTFSNGDIAITNYFLKNQDTYFYCEQDKSTAYLYKKL